MAEKPIKVDERTDDLVTDLACFLRCSKKSVVRDAVAEFAETHHPRFRAESGALAGAGAGGVTFEALDPWDRLALRRRELLRRFSEHGGTDVRVLHPDDEDAASDESAPTRIVLLAETDPVDGSAAVPALEEVARGVLGVHVTVVSLTALRMFGSGRFDRALAESRPL